MKQIQTEVLVVGGGATGAGVVRDLAMRGFKCILIEKKDLSHGTTGRYHGLLHSGGRYAVKDPSAAQECIEENRILRRIMPHCIEDTGGLFVVTPWDDPSFAPRFVDGCRQAGIPVEETSLVEMLRAEPLLNPRISHCFRVPDASADSFLGTEANAQSARQHGAQILNYTRLITLLKQGNRVVGARCHDLVKDEELEISADMVVNAAGAWSGKVAATAGIQVKIIPGKGTMLAFNHRLVNTVVNRCKMPSDGDIFVPAHTVAVIGTTDTPVLDPDSFGIEPWEVELMLEEGEKLVPGLKQMRVVRAWAGVRPLYQETVATENRDVTRAFVLLDHESRDGLSGLVTITSGKWTTYRKMAEVTVDLVCAKLAVQRECRTHLEQLPGDEGHGYHHLGARLAEIEKDEAYGDLICECELATYAQVKQAILEKEAKTIDDIRRDVRLGMGPCQGGFCALRAAGMLHALHRPPVEETNLALRDFLQERWKGLMPVLWGEQLRQERLDELIYQFVFNAGRLPGPAFSRLAPEAYTISEVAASPPKPNPVSHTSQYNSSISSINEKMKTAQYNPALDVLVIGAGLAGQAAAWQAARRGKSIRLISKGLGAFHWSSGCIDVLGYSREESEMPVENPGEAVKRLVAKRLSHPYALTGIDGLEEALLALQALCDQAGYPLRGSLDRNWLLPTALGTARPTCLAPLTMVEGDLKSKQPMLIVGFERFPDFYPDWIADNLDRQGILAQGIVLKIESLHTRRFVTDRSLALAFDLPEFRSEVAHKVRSLLPKGNNGKNVRIGFPSVLGWERSKEVWQDLQEKIGCPVFEIPGLPPSIPGIRLHNILMASIKSEGGVVYDGMQVQDASADDRILAVYSEAAARRKAHRASHFVLATGGILGGGINLAFNGEAHETVFGLPVCLPADRRAWFNPIFLNDIGHPLYRSGVRVDQNFQPLTEEGEVVYKNLYAAGCTLADFDPIQERSLEGVALATGYRVGTLIS
jgi:glycerol-3-phosphate dehydrogenase